jgi:ABC transport system ATP-binding/permease protein
VNSQPLPPAITVRVGGWQRTFPPGHDVVIGRDVRADIRIPHPGVSRSHLILRCRDGHWTAVDDHSFNGVYVGTQRVQSVDIRGGETVNIGNPDGPRLTFDVAPPPDARPTSPMRAAESATVRIGRGSDNDIVVPDVLASSHHATLVLTPRGPRIEQVDRNTATYVNGTPVRNAPLSEHDVVTIGNVDFVYAGGQLARRVEPAAATGGLDVREVGLTIAGGKTLLDRVSFDAAPGTLTAVIGPSGSGKSTLANAIVGLARPTAGTVTFEGHDLHAEYASLRGRIGLVPQDDVVHGGLTIRQALDFAAELRMPPDTSEAERGQAISQVLEELQLTPHADTRVDKLSGGQRKRVGIGIELLTGPSLLVLDEPTTGLDPALDQQIMRMLRELAEAGRVVIVITHSLMFLDVCDQVVLLAPGGRIAFCGPLADVDDQMGATDWADIFTAVCDDPDGAQQRFLARSRRGPASPPAPVVASAAVRPARPHVRGQVVTLARRHLQLIVANRGYLAFLIALPLVIGLLPLAVGGDTGLRASPPAGVGGFQTKQILGLVNLCAVFMGTALSVRELVGERPIFRHEQAAGVSTSAYLVAKIVVLGAIGLLQSAILVGIVTAVRGSPPDASALGAPTLELFIGVAATCVTAMVLGLLVSTFARTANQVFPLTVALLMAQIVFAGGMVSMPGRWIDPVSWLSPSRWGLAATASTANLTEVVPKLPRDTLWLHTASTWWLDIAMLALLAALCAGVARWRIRLRTWDR